jgi:hypothetical protein
LEVDLRQVNGSHRRARDVLTVLVRGERAVAVPAAGDPDYLTTAVAISAERDAVRVSMPLRRAWPGIDPCEPYRWTVSAWTDVPGSSNAYIDDGPRSPDGPLVPGESDCPAAPPDRH